MKFKIKHLLSCMLIALMFVGGVSFDAFAADDYSFDETKGELIIYSADGLTSWKTAVPEENIKSIIVKEAVTEIKSQTISSFPNLENLVYEGNVVFEQNSLGSMPELKNLEFKGESVLPNGAFAYSTKLANVFFGGKTALGNGAFGFNSDKPNTELKKVSFPKGSTFGPAFYNCIALEEIIFEGDAQLFSSGFWGLPELKKIEFKGESVIASNFTSVTKLASVSFGGKTKIGSGGFWCDSTNPNTALKELTFPAGSTFENAAFGNYAAVEKITFEGDVVLTAGGCFENNSELKSIDFKGKSTIGPAALLKAGKLTSILFGGATTLETNAFADAGQKLDGRMDAIVLPEGSSVGVAAFVNAKISSVEFLDATPPVVGVSAFYGCPEDAVIYVPCSAVEAYTAVLNNVTAPANPVPLAIEGKHYGGTATCEAKAICEKCNQPYGKYDEHNYGELQPAQEAIHTQTELKSGVDAYYFCDVCDKYFTEDKVETTLEELMGEVPEHSFGNWINTDAEKHWRECSCGLRADEANHEYGNDQDMECDECGYEKEVDGEDKKPATDAAAPETGDVINSSMWLALLIVSGLCATKILFIKKRRV